MSDYYEKVARWRARFDADIKGHTLTVVRDDGLYRHLHCQKPETYCMSFDIVTWPGHLCYTGDMGSYVFARIPDMLSFFRRDGDHVDFQYFAQKCLAQDRHDGIDQFDDDAFERAIFEWRDCPDADADEHARRAEQLSDSGLLDDAMNSGNEHECMRAAMEFRYARADGSTFYPLAEIFQRNLREFSGRFWWACFAIVWAVAEYDRQAAGIFPTAGHRASYGEFVKSLGKQG